VSKLSRVNPFVDQDVTSQLDSWAAALEMAVATLNQTLEEVKTFKEKGAGDARDRTAEADEGSG
jgi:hypothetical protein